MFTHSLGNQYSYQVVMTYDGEVGKFFVNGIEVAYLGDGRDERGALKETNLPLYIGGAGHTEYFTGLVDEARIYSRVLTSTDVLRLYEQRSPSQCIDKRKLGSFDRPAVSCRAIQAAGAAMAGTSSYWLTAGTKKFLAHCDFDEDDGGWTLILDVRHGAWTSTAQWEDTLPKAYQQSIFAASTQEFRFTATDGSNRKLFIKDPNPYFLSSDGSCEEAHTWRTQASQISCRSHLQSSYVAVNSKNVNCCSSTVGVHTCGSGNGWILFHNGRVVSPDSLLLV